MVQSKETEMYGQMGLGLVFHANGQMREAYQELRKAKIRRIKKADDYIKKHFQSYLDSTKNTILTNNNSSIKENEQSKLISSISGDFWIFQDLNSKKMVNVPDEMMSRIKQSLKFNAVLITANGMLMVTEGNCETLTYRMKEQTSTNASLDLIALDGEKQFNMKISLMADILSISKEKDEWVLLKREKISSLDPSSMLNISSNITRNDLEFLGKNIQPLLDNIYK